MVRDAATPLETFSGEQEIIRVSDEVCCAVPSSGNGVHIVHPTPTLDELKAKREYHRTHGSIEGEEWEWLNKQIAFLEP